MISAVQLAAPRLLAGMLIERIVIRPVEHAPVLSVVIVFIALLVILNSLAGWIYTYTIKYLLSERVVGWYNNILDWHPYQYVDVR